jgi:phage terminase large subunit-like protein
MSRQQKIEYLTLLEEKAKRKHNNKLKDTYEAFYPWQRQFNAATKDNDFCLLMAANQVGKSLTGCAIDAYHLTGEYPDDWEGHRFDFPPRCWLLGFSMEKTRDLLQEKLFGKYQEGSFPGGNVRAELILGHLSATGTPNAMREVQVRHKSGGISVVQFWSYSQGEHALMGDVVDWFHIDEEPRDQAIYPQVITRTINGNKGKGGKGILTFTPENGRTELVIQFMDNASKGQYYQRVEWKDAPHITPEKAERMLAQYPAWQRDMRTKGLPLLGTGLIFDLDMDACKVKPFECPDHWLMINGMDFGWDHPQSHVQLWINPDEWIIYVARAMKVSKKQPYEAWQMVKMWADKIPSAWPADGFQTEKGTGKTQKSYYEEAGWYMLHSQATWPTGGNSVEQGLIEIYKLIQLGQFKIFDHLADVFDEFSQYHRDEHGKIVKVKDDILDAIRYAYMMRRYAIRKSDIDADEDYEPESTSRTW